MSKKITAASLAILIVALLLTVGGINPSSDKIGMVSYGNIDTYAAKETTSTTQSLGDFVADKVEGATVLGDVVADASDALGGLGGSLGGFGDSFGGISDALGGIGDALGGLINDANSGSGNNGGSNSDSPTYDVNKETMAPIDIVPAVSGFEPVSSTKPAETETSPNLNETVDFAAEKNPYKRPDGDLRGGDEGEGVKWMQWIFIYTRYGLKDDGITGVFDEDTVAVVKKLQKENGLTPDGIVTDEVADKIELLYFQATLSSTAPASETQSEAETTAPVSVDTGSENNNAGILVLVVIVALVWLAAIGFIIAFIIIKKKKTPGKAKKNKKGKKSKAASSEADGEVNEASETEDSNDYSEIGDLFGDNNK